MRPMGIKLPLLHVNGYSDLPDFAQERNKANFRKDWIENEKQNVFVLQKAYIKRYKFYKC